MSRRLLLGAASLVGLLALAAWWMSALERVPIKSREPPQLEARRNPWLALERLTVRLGGALTRSSDIRLLDRLPDGGTLLLARQRGQVLTPARVQRLLAWVEEGGYLIVVAEFPGVADPLLERLGVKREWTSPSVRGDASVEVVVPGAARALNWGRSRYGLTLEGDRLPEWSAAVGQPAQLLHFRLGRGQLTVAAGLDDRLNNRQIAKFDHAELYWTLLERYDQSPSPRVLLLARLEMPTLFAWLWQHAWTVCLAALLLLILGLARIIPRFGEIRPQAPAARRELREHLAAIGRYQWRTGELAALLAPAREHFQRRLALRQPAIAALPPAAQAPALAALSQRPAVLINTALVGQASTAREFTDAVGLLHHLERDL